MYKMTLLIEKYLVHKCAVKLSKIENRSEDSIVKQILSELDLVDPEGEVPRRLINIKNMAFLVRDKLHKRRLSLQPKAPAPATGITKYIMIRYPHSAGYLAKFPNECKLVLDSESVLTVMVPEHLV